MSTSLAAAFGFRVRRTGNAWTWKTYDPAGRPRASGLAPSRAAAAAFAIQDLVGEQAHPRTP